MADIIQINGVVKVNPSGNKIYYYFPSGFITALISEDSFDYEPLGTISYYDRPSKYATRVTFAGLADNLGAADVEGYLDLCAETGQLFFNAPNVVSLTSGANIDASGRLRVSQLNTLLDIKQFKDNSPLLLDRENIGSGAQVHDGTDGTDMAVTTTADAAISQSFQRATYFSGKSQLIEATFSGGHNQTNVTKRVGYFTSNTTTPFDSTKDGIWFEADGTDYRFRIQKAGVDILNVTQANWNVNTASWFDASKFNVFVIQFLYLGGTQIRLGFIDRGAIKWCHDYNHAGQVAGTFVNSPQQPIRYEIRSTGGAGTLKQVCMQVASEGSTGELGIPSFMSTTQTLATGGTNYAVLGFRLKSGFKDIVVQKEKVTFNATTADDFEWFLCLNPTYSVGVTYTDVTNSAVQGYGGNTTITDFGYILDGGSFQGNTSSVGVLIGKIKAGFSIAGVADEIVVVVKPKSNNMTIDAALTLTELR